MASGVAGRRSNMVEGLVALVRGAVGALLAGATVGLAWYWLQRELALDGGWLGGRTGEELTAVAVAIGSLLAVLSGLLIGYWSSDRGAVKGLWVVLPAVAGATVTLVAMRAAGVAAMEGTSVTAEDLTPFAESMPWIGAGAALIGSARQSDALRDSSGVGALCGLALLPVALVAGINFIDVDRLTERAAAEASTTTVPTTVPTTSAGPEPRGSCVTSPIGCLQPKYVGCYGERDAVAAGVSSANALSFTPGSHFGKDPSHFIRGSYGTYYTWQKVDGGYVAVPVGDPRC